MSDKPPSSALATVAIPGRPTGFVDRLRSKSWLKATRRFGRRVVFLACYLSYRARACLVGERAFRHSSQIGNNVYVGPLCAVGSVEAENDVLLGGHIHIISGKQQHGIGDLARPIRRQPGAREQGLIGDDTRVGNGAIEMADIGRTCVICSATITSAL